MENMFGGLLNTIKGSVFGGLLQDDDQLLAQYVPPAVRSTLSPEDQQDLINTIRGTTTSTLLNKGTSQDRFNFVQQQAFNNLALKQGQARQAEQKALASAADDYIAQATRPTVDGGMALSAQGMPAGPTNERAALVGQANPNRLDLNQARANAYMQMAQRYAVNGNAELAEKYQKLAQDLLPKPDEYAANVTIAGPDGKPQVVAVSKNMKPTVLGNKPNEETPEIQTLRVLAGDAGLRQVDQDRKRAGAASTSVAVNTNDPTAVAKAGMGLQNDVRSAFKDDNTIAGAYSLMSQAVRNPSPQGDTTLLYSFFKVLDPASTVREGELDLVMSSRSIPDKYKAYAQKLSQGLQLLPNEREDILRQAGGMVKSRMARTDKDVTAYRDNAARLGLDPSLYVPHPFSTVNVPGDGLDLSKVDPRMLAHLRATDQEGLERSANNFYTRPAPAQPSAKPEAKDSLSKAEREELTRLRQKYGK